MDSVPAVRLVYAFPKPSATQYQKVAFVARDGRLFEIGYAAANFVWCDAPPISEEAVYEHLVSTWEFAR